MIDCSRQMARQHGSLLVIVVVVVVVVVVCCLLLVCKSVLRPQSTLRTHSPMSQTTAFGCSRLVTHAWQVVMADTFNILLFSTGRVYVPVALYLSRGCMLK